MNNNRFDGPIGVAPNTTETNEDTVSQEQMQEYVLKPPQEVRIGVAS